MQTTSRRSHRAPLPTSVRVDGDSLKLVGSRRTLVFALRHA